MKLDVLKKTCEVTAWCPVENKKNPRCCHVLIYIKGIVLI